MISMQKFIYYSCLFLFPQFLVGQTASLTARVIDATTKAPLVGANLFLQSDILGGTYTDEEGQFQLAKSPQETDTLFVSYIGYQSAKYAIPKDYSTLQTIELQANTFETAMVEVKATRIIAEEFSVASIGQLDIYTNPNAKADPLLAVQSLPASTSADESANVSLRGSPPSETGIFLNNVPIKDAVRLDQINGVGQFSIFNTALLKSVHVFPSNPPLEVGNATSGAVLMQTSDKVPEKVNSLSLTLAGMGLYASRKITAATGLTLYANLGTQHGLKGLNRKSFERIHSFGSIDGGVQFLHQFNKQIRFKFFNYSLTENYAYQQRSPSYEGLLKQQKKRNMSIVNISKQWENSQLEINQLYDWSTTDFAFGNLDLNIQSQNLYTSINYHHFGKLFSTKTGLAFDHNKEDFNGTYPLYNHAVAPEHPVFSLDTLTNIKVPEAYIYSRGNLGKLQLGGGLRYHPAYLNLPAWLSKQLNIRLPISAAHSLLLSAGKYHKVNIPNENTAAIFKISSRHYAVEYQYEQKNWELSSSLYYKQTKYQNLTNPILGAEFFAAWTFPNFKGSFSFAHIHSVLEDGEQSVATPYDFDYFLRLIAKYNIPNLFELSLVYLHRQGQYFQPLIGKDFHEATNTWQPWFAPPNQAIRLPVYRLLDLSISKIVPFGEGSLVVFFSANNVLNTKNVQGYTYNFDYTAQTAERYNERVFFMGGVWTF